MKIDYNLIFDENYLKLNKAQKEAVDTIDGPVMVLAGPGAGKTQLLSMRVANILKLTDTRPSNILCLTFTDSGAKNMKDRLSKIIGPEAFKVNIMTFHGFAKSIMNYYPEKFFNGATPKLMDDYSRKLLYKEILQSIRKENFKNQLTIEHKEQGFVYQNTIDKRIKQFKSNGITPKDLERIIKRSEIELEYLNEIIPRYFNVTMSAKVYETIPNLIAELQSNYIENQDKLIKLGDIKTLTRTYCDKLREIYELYKNNPELKATPLTGFKANYLYKDKGRVLPLETKCIEKLKDLIEIYHLYEVKIEESANIDFDDQVRIVVETLEKNEQFRLLVQSKYHYILVDEFQDTSLLQLKLINNLFDLELTEGRPNVMVVGDDDQSIYKFQGANVQNLLSFAQYFPVEPKLISLNTNYRSAKNIVEFSKEIVDYSIVRFSNMFKGFDKDIKAHKEEDGNIHFKSYNTYYDEVADICAQVQELKNQGVDLSEICIIARNHKQIAPFARHLEKLEIPLKYEKGQDVLKSQHILELIKLATLILNIVDGKYVDPLLSEVLCSEYWNLKGIDIYRLATVAKSKKMSWLETMLEANTYNLNPYFVEVANWLIEVSSIAKRYSAERMLDILIGQKNDIGSEQSEIDFTEHMPEDQAKWRNHLDSISKFSPFGRYYFNFNRLSLEYLSTLSALKTLINKVREYRKTSFLRIVDLVEFFQFHLEENLHIIDNNVFNQDAKAVSLMTGHKTKGLEFDCVFVTSCNEETWFDSKGFTNKLALLSNMPFEGIPEDDDDKLRLLYVAFTRAKMNLYISRYENNESDKITNPARVLSNKPFIKIEVPKDKLSEIVAENIFDQGLDTDISLEKLLRPLIEDYKMPVTHLWNYLDLDNGRGPKYFIENNLLRFPCSKNPSSSYGTAIHSALHGYYTRAKNGPVSEQDLIKEFVIALDSENLEERDYKPYRERGIESLKYFYDTREIEEDYKTELDFNFEDVLIGEAKVTGKIDKIVIEKSHDKKNYLTVVDYKTGKGFAKFDSKSKNLENYKLQLIFYKLMIEHSSINDNNTYIKSLCLDFIEKGEHTGIKVFDISNMDLDIEIAKKLINVVYKKITNLDFKIPEEIINLKKDKNKAFQNWLLNN
jgi:DNA helicase II / ATP-dependent DNA helicase PcrA